MTKIADIIRLPLTPEEAEAIAEPAVQQEIAHLNALLARGKRIFIVDDGLVAPLKKALEMKGWAVELGPDLGCGSRTFLLRPAKIEAPSKT